VQETVGKTGVSDEAMSGKTVTITETVSVTKTVSVPETVSVTETVSGEDGSMSQRSCMSNMGNGGSMCDGSSMGNYWGNWGGVWGSDDCGGRGAVCGSWLIGVNDSPESVSVSDVVYSASSSVDVVEGVGSLLVSVAISNFGTRVAGTMSINNVVTESVVAKSILMP
jgi:hypothetical protein